MNIQKEDAADLHFMVCNRKPLTTEIIFAKDVTNFFIFLSVLSLLSSYFVFT
jgi:hypothetical protein